MDSAIQAIERLKALARLVLAAGLGLAFLLAPPRGTPLYWVVAFTFAVYFIYALALLRYPQYRAARRWRAAALAGDAAALAVVFLLGPSLPAAFLLFFVYFSLVAGLWGGWWAAAGLSLLASAIYLLLAWRAAGGGGWPGALPRESWLVAGGLLAVGALVGTVARRERARLDRTAEVERLAGLLRLEPGWPEPARRWLEELARRYRAARVLLVWRDPENDRVRLWDWRSGDGGGRFDESDRPPRDAHEFLLDFAPVAFSATGLGTAAAEWHPPDASSMELPARWRDEFQPRTLASVPLPGGVGGRVFLLEGPGCAPAELDDLEGLLRGLGPVLENLLVARSLVARALEEERDAIVRHLHDGVAQTLASVEMQLNVYRRLLADDPGRTAEELAALQGVVKQEQEELRRYLRTLKPLRVPASELGRWMLAHCAQFQQETGIEVELWADPVETTLPEGVCREVFWILREALHNVHKHARAQHVLVRLRQDPAFLRLLVDDDGCGFSFAGTYSQRALEEQGLGPVSICERTRALGGTLTLDSTPGSGSTLRVDIPLT